MTRQDALALLRSELSQPALLALATILETTEVREKVVGTNEDGDDVYGDDIAGTLKAVAAELRNSC